MDPVASAFSIKNLFSGTLNPLQVILTLLTALLIGLFLFFIYKRTFAGVVYSRSFNLSLVMLTMVSSLVIMLISSNLTLSLGMVGALSIVRFRTAIKDPIDTVFLFWAVGEGLALDLERDYSLRIRWDDSTESLLNSGEVSVLP